MSGTGSVSPLPGSVSEVTDLKKILKSKGWKVSQLVGVNASELKLRKSSSTVVHLATHGFFGMVGLNEDAMSSSFVNPSLLKTGLVLAGGGELIDSKENVMSSDGVLTAYEAMDLNYDGTELVVLSACNTGVGDWTMGEGVFGLQRSFLAAGADNVMMSLFKVPDAATAELMNLFYEDWIRTGDKHHALKYAKIELRKKYPHPFYWGSFVLVGASE
jgi:CHAT domain-containing protein